MVHNPILSAADRKWPDVIQTVARQYGVNYSDAEVGEPSLLDISNIGLIQSFTTF